MRTAESIHFEPQTDRLCSAIIQPRVIPLVLIVVAQTHETRAKMTGIWLAFKDPGAKAGRSNLTDKHIITGFAGHETRRQTETSDQRLMADETDELIGSMRLQWRVSQGQQWTWLWLSQRPRGYGTAPSPETRMSCHQCCSRYVHEPSGFRTCSDSSNMHGAYLPGSAGDRWEVNGLSRHLEH